MGNYQFYVSNPPQRGQTCVIIDNAYTTKEEIPKEVLGQGKQAKVLGSKDLLCSRPSAPKVTCTMVQFPKGNIDVYFSNMLKPV